MAIWMAASRRWRKGKRAKTKERIAKWAALLIMVLVVGWVFVHKRPIWVGVPASSVRGGLRGCDHVGQHGRGESDLSRAVRANPGASFPDAYFGVRTRFLFYTAGYGQFNNQVVSLVNALFMARRADAVLVLPFAKLGKESTWDMERAGMDAELTNTRELVGDYFNYTALLAAEHVVRPSSFLASVDGNELLRRKNITTCHRSGGYYRKLFDDTRGGHLKPSYMGIRVLSPDTHTVTKIASFCDFDPDHVLATVQERGRNDRFTFLPIVFRRHNLNCTRREKDWVAIRRNIVPRDEYLTAIDSFMTTLSRPILAIHLRFFLNGDIGEFTARSLVDMMFRDFGPELMEARSLFVAYSPSSDISRQVFGMLQTRFYGNVVNGSAISQHFEPTHREYGLLALSNVLMDMWVCVKSDIFLGRKGSSLSWNTVYWRQALADQYGLQPELVARPLWYTLDNFTTTGTHRNEGSDRDITLLYN